MVKEPGSGDKNKMGDLAGLIRRLFKLDYTAHSVESLGRMFVEIVAESLDADRAALLSWRPDDRSLVLVDAAGFEPDTEVVVRDATPPARFARIDEDASNPPMARALQQFIQTPLVLWAYDEASGFGLVLGCGPSSDGRFDAADQEFIESVLDVFANVVERKRAEQRLTHDAFHDALTGLPNRNLFLEHLEQAMERARRGGGYLFSVLFIDIDRFKVMNDSLGHAVGDQLLTAFGQRVRQTVRGCDVVARLGGDEFAVLADDLAELGDALRLADRIREELKAPFVFDGQAMFLSASTGIARNAVRYTSAADLLRDADIAMQRAKVAGGAGHRMFDADMHTAMVERMQVETDLRRAVEDDQLRLVYQPIVDIRDGTLTGFEALLRWRHPDRGLVMPAEFIDVAEESGMIVPIGRWVISEVCRRLVLLNQGRSRQVSISVNLSDREFLQPGLVDAIDAALRETGAPPDLLHLELTERMLLAQPRMEVEVLPRLKELGVKVMIDDFGTGYSSLSRIARLPIDSLKVDYSFIRDLGHGGNTGEVVRAVVTLAHTLGISVVAEGVERAEQLALLREVGCDHVQGFLISHPLDDQRVAPDLLQESWLPA